ncbi:MAG TPA: bifunctional DNA primase/polymerase [Pseudonocardiaceae bacterium]|nr:bifunctional DNA primase/polymerase [Pseudonocardiaceae bacterium]
MGGSPFLSAALAAAGRGWSVFPLVPAGKTPAIREWEKRATTDRRQICRWWVGEAGRNVGVAAGKSGLVVVDLDSGDGACPPERFAGARDGRDVLAMVAAEVGAELPTDTYAVQTPGGCHLYFRVPAGLRLRNTTGRLGWRIDTRAHGGYVVAAGSQRSEGKYRVIHRGPVAELPGWLAEALAPVPIPGPGRPMWLSRRRGAAYVRAIVNSEAREVAAAQTGTRHDVLLKAARTLGRLVGGDELGEDDAWRALLDAAAGHIGVEGCTVGEVRRAIGDGIAYGKRLPRRITSRPA